MPLSCAATVAFPSRIRSFGPSVVWPFTQVCVNRIVSKPTSFAWRISAWANSRVRCPRVVLGRADEHVRAAREGRGRAREERDQRDEKAPHDGPRVPSGSDGFRANRERS